MRCSLKAHWTMVNPYTFTIHRNFPYRVDTMSELICTTRRNGLNVYHKYFSVFCFHLVHVVCFLQIPLHSVQCLCAVHPGSAPSPAARTVPPPGPFPQAGGPKSGGGGRPGPQLEGWTHDASDPTMLCCLFFMNKLSPDSIQSHMLDSWGDCRANEPAVLLHQQL